MTIPAGEFDATATLTLTLVDDTLYEGIEQVAVQGANEDPGLPVNGVLIAIVDNDPKPTTIILSFDPTEVPEGQGVSFLDIQATLEGPSTLKSDVVISVSLVNLTQSSANYGGSLRGALSILAGQSEAATEITLFGINDDVDDPDETIKIRGTANNPDLTVTPGRLVLTNDDASGVTVEPASLTVQEGKRGFYTVRLDSQPTSDVTVTIDLPSNAPFTVNPGSLTFTPQSWRAKSVIVSGIVDPDGNDEPPAVITHSVSSSDLKYDGAPSDGATMTVMDTTTATVTVTAVDDDIDDDGEILNLSHTVAGGGYDEITAADLDVRSNRQRHRRGDHLRDDADHPGRKHGHLHRGAGHAAGG